MSTPSSQTPRKECLAKCASCTRCHSAPGVAAVRAAPCGCAVALCAECVGRTDTDGWITGYSGLHCDVRVASLYGGAPYADASGCPRCFCTGTEFGCAESEIDRRRFVSDLRQSFLSDSGMDVSYPVGDDVPDEWRREAVARQISRCAERVDGVDKTRSG